VVNSYSRIPGTQPPEYEDRFLPGEPCITQEHVHIQGHSIHEPGELCILFFAPHIQHVGSSPEEFGSQPKQTPARNTGGRTNTSASRYKHKAPFTRKASYAPPLYLRFIYLKVPCSYYVSAMNKFALLLCMSEFCCYVLLNF